MSPTLIIPKENVSSKYCESVHKTVRRPTRTIYVGKVKLGSDHPIARQTMTTTDTRNVAATVAQVKKCADAGADIVRITVQGKKEAEACMKIREQLFKDRYDTPLVADIHFQPGVAMMVADAFEKIRINPGNFVDGRKSFKVINYDDPKEFEREREEIEQTLMPLVEKCRKLNRAMRIGTNHGSLSARILSYYGDTPRGMVESAFEFADICRKHNYHNFLFSMKASNPLVMVQAYRLLSEEMYKRQWDYPLHLGVTEAGEGEDGRMKSAIGIGSLLLDGLGDTIRVSLTEDPELEIVPCSRLANLGHDACAVGLGAKAPFTETTRNTHLFARRHGALPVQVATDGAFDYRNVLHRDGTVYSTVTLAELIKDPEVTYKRLGAKLAVGMPFKDVATSDAILLDKAPGVADKAGRRALKRLQDIGLHAIVPASELLSSSKQGGDVMPGLIAKFSLRELAARKQQQQLDLPQGIVRYAIEMDGTETDSEWNALLTLNPIVILLNVKEPNSRLHLARRLFEFLKTNNVTLPVVHVIEFAAGTSRDELVIKTGANVGGCLVDGLGDGVSISAPHEDVDFLRSTAFGLLQGSRMRNTKTEYVSCPSCGRTLFNLQEVSENIRQKTGHLPGVAIAVMGCIVNGPGEMADADFGYVGGAPGKIDLYVGKEVVKRGVPMDSAVDDLVQLIKDHGRWVEPSV